VIATVTGQRRRWTGALAVAAAAALVVAGCGGGDDGGDGGGGGGGGGKKGGGTVKVGNISSIAGLGGTFSGFQAGVKGYFEYYNGQGGIDGTKVDLIAIDDAADPGKAASGARKLVTQDKVVAIVGMASLADAAVAKYLNAAKIPVVGGWATSSAWHKPNTNMFVSLEGPNEPYCSIWSNDLAKAEGVNTMAFVAQDFPAATKDADCRSTAAKKVGITQSGDRIDVSLTAADYRPAMQRATAGNPDGVYFSTGADGILKGVQAGDQLGFKGTYVAT
jgi:ABC-type branched-subunit amino acid transport system substrate-binding protein